MSTPADQTSQVTHFYGMAEWTGVMDDDREAWLALRKSMITASDMAAIMGEGYKRDALAVYVDKTTERLGPEEILIDDPRFWGKVLEQPILSAVAAYYDWEYHRGGALLRSRRYPFLGCTLDAEISKDGDLWIPFEGKTSIITKGWDEAEQDLPTRVNIQVQHQLLVTGAQVAYVFALLQGSRPCLIEVKPHDGFHAAIIDAGLEFMERVRTLNPPPPTEHSARSLERLYPESNGTIVELPLEAVAWTERLQAIPAEEKALDAEKKRLRNKITDAIGNATFGELPQAVNGKKFWRWLEALRAGYTVVHEPKMAWSLFSLKEATYPDQKGAGVTSVTGPEDLAEGEAAVRMRGRRRGR